MQEEMLEAKVQGQVSRFRLMGNIPVADRRGRGHGPLGPVNINHKKDGH